MSFKEKLTPINTEEIKPGFFIQKKGNNYRQVNPIVWNNNWRLRKQFSWKNLIWIFILLGIIWAYNEDNRQLTGFYNMVHEDPVKFCTQVLEDLATPGCTDFQLSSGLCDPALGTIKIDGDTVSLP